MKKSRYIVKHSLIMLLTTCLILSQTAIAVSAKTETATTLRLSSVEGTVTLADINGKTKFRTDDMKLAGGDAVETAEKSYAYLELDSKKAAKLDAVSELSIRQKGKKLELLLSAGNLFFNVKEPLAGDETLNIRTSTMVTGIRGTAGYVNVVDGNTTELFLLEGSASISTTNPATGKTEEARIRAGQKATVYGNIAQDTTSRGQIVLSGFTEKEVPGFVANEVAKDSALQDRISKEGALDVGAMIDGADDKLKDDQKKTEEAIASKKPNPEDSAGSNNKIPVFDTGSTGSGGSSGSGGSKPDPAPDPAPDPEPPVRETQTVTGPITAADLNALLANTDVTLSGAVPLNIDENVTLPVNGRLMIGAGITTNIAAGKTLQIDGHMETAGDIANSGTINNTSSNTLIVQGSLINDLGATIINTGKLAVKIHVENDVSIGGVLENNGTFENQGELLVDVSIDNNSIFIDTSAAITKSTEFNNGYILNDQQQMLSNGVVTLNGTLEALLNNDATVTLNGTLQGNVNNEDQFTLNGTMQGTLTNNPGDGYALLKGGRIVGGSESAVVYEGGVVTMAGTHINNDGTAPLVLISAEPSIRWESGYLESSNIIIKNVFSYSDSTPGNITIDTQSFGMTIKGPEESMENLTDGYQFALSDCFWGVSLAANNTFQWDAGEEVWKLVDTTNTVRADFLDLDLGLIENAQAASPSDATHVEEPTQPDADQDGAEQEESVQSEPDQENADKQEPIRPDALNSPLYKEEDDIVPDIDPDKEAVVEDEE